MSGDLLSGDIINQRYRRLRELGRGGMGVVYLVDDLIENRRLALKTIPPGQGDHRAEDSFKEEFRALSHLVHPNLVRVYDYGLIQETGEQFFTSEYVEGRDLFGATEGLDPKAIAELLVQVLRALEFIHSHGLIHHDIKPENILVERAHGGPHVRLMDFGLARLDPMGLGRSAIRGTLRYLAPEVAAQGRVDRRADLYALGVVMFQVFTRRLPFEETGLVALIAQHREAEPPDPCALASGLEPALGKLILKLLAKEPYYRPASAREVIRALGDALGVDFPLETERTRESYILSAPMVGRDLEFAALVRQVGVLRGASTEASTETRVALVTGEAGVGKTRLLNEFALHVQLEQRTVVRGSAAPGAGEVFQVWIEVLRQLVPLARSLRDHERGRTLLELHGADLARLLPELREQPSPGRGPTSSTGEPSMESQLAPLVHVLPPQQERIRLLDSLASFLVDLANLSPYLLILDDLHGCDANSAGLLLHLVRRFRTQPPPLLVVLAFREDGLRESPLAEVLEAIAAELPHQRLPLARLEERQVGRLLASMLGRSSGAESERRRKDDGSRPHPLRQMVRDIARESGGNPLFLREWLKQLAEHAVYSADADRWRLEPEILRQVRLPSSIAELLQVRLTQLSEDELEQVQILSALHGPVSADLLTRIQRALATSSEDLPRPAPRSAETLLHALRQRGLVVCRSRQLGEFWEPDPQALREIVYQGLSASARRRLHQAIVEALEKDPRALAEGVDELAYHAQAASDRARARKYLVHAGDRAAGLHDNARACQYYHTALGLGHRRECRRLLSTLGELHLLAGEFDDSLRAYDELLTLPGVERGAPRAEVLRAIGTVHQHLGNLTRARGFYEQAIAELGSDDAVLAATLLREIGALALMAGDDDQARLCAHQALKTLMADQEGDAQHERSPEALNRRDRALVSVHLLNGDIQAFRHQNVEAVEAYVLARRLSERLHDDVSLAAIFHHLGSIHALEGDYEEAQGAYHKALELRRRTGDKQGIAHTLNNLGWIEGEQGRFGAAAAHYREGLALSVQMGAEPLTAALHSHLGLTAAEQGHFGDALDHLDQSMAKLEHLGLVHDLGTVRIHRLHVLITLGDQQAVESELPRLFKSLEQEHSILNRGQLQLIAARLAKRQGNAPGAIQAAREALAAFRAARAHPAVGDALLLAAQIHHEEGADEEAIAALEQCLEIVSRLDAPRLLGRYFLIKARLAHRAGHDVLNLGASAPLGRTQAPLGLAPAASCGVPAPAQFVIGSAGGEHLAKALKHAEQAGRPELLIEVHHALGRHHHEAGRRRQAGDHYAVAAELIRKCYESLPSGLREHYLSDRKRERIRRDSLLLLREVRRHRDTRRIKRSDTQRRVAAEKLQSLSDKESLSEARGRARGEREAQRRLASASVQLRAAVGPEETLAAILDGALDFTGAAQVQLIEPRGLNFVALGRRGAPLADGQQLPPYAQELAREIVTQQSALASGCAHADVRFARMGKVRDRRLCSVLGFPIRRPSRSPAVLLVEHPDQVDRFDEGDAVRLAVFCELAALRWAPEAGPGPPAAREAASPLIGRGPRLLQALEQAHSLAASGGPVAIAGESGTGKLRLARLLHQQGPRAAGSFLVLPCRSPVGPLAHALWDATEGLWSRARGGTLVFDGLEALPLGGQERIAGALRAEAGARGVLATVREALPVLAASGRLAPALQQEFAGRLVELPPLREREGDVTVLLRHFCGLAGGREISPAALRSLARYPWPGNVRELEQLVRELALRCPETITRADLPPSIFRPRPVAASLKERLEAFERQLVLDELARWRGNKSRAAQALGLSRRGLYKKLEALGLSTR